MKITVIATGKCKDKHVTAIYDEFIKRARPHFEVSLVEVASAKGDAASVKRQESKNQLAKIPDNAFLIALDEKGKLASTAEFAETLRKQRDNGIREVCLVIGGADGISDDIRQRANMMLSLSKLTFPHMLVRPIIFEQIYRAGSLLAGHPYHRAN